jgi:cytochrome c-type biogenesis protein CcmH
MPLANARHRAAEWPPSLNLDDALAMLPALRRSAHPRIVVAARLARSGPATPQPGDLEGEAPALTTTAGDAVPQVAVEIGRVRR